jgi:hypothetical protein
MSFQFAPFDIHAAMFRGKSPRPIPFVLGLLNLAAMTGIVPAQTTITVTRTASTAISANSLVYVTSAGSNQVAPGLA